MFDKSLKNKVTELSHRCEALDALINSINMNVATIRFDPEGNIKGVNDLFLGVVGYNKEDVLGKHHKIFCDPSYVKTAEYKAFWEVLRAGKSKTGTFKRITKQGNVIWLEASYFPIKNADGLVTGIFKIASDVSKDQQRIRDLEAAYGALNRSMAIIEFDPQGNILNANDNFLDVVGYSMDQITGKHHRIFCFDRFYQENPNFWGEISNGNFFTGQFERKDALGHSIWLEASYNPVFDENNRVIKVIKFASDITERVNQRENVLRAAEIWSATTEETTQITENGVQLLNSSVQKSAVILQDVSDTSAFIEQLNEEAKNIQKIVSTISDIAEQTNLLALNAAIEAARAGEQGRGFAVVADEVRALASRTQASTEEIRQTIEGLKKEVVDCVGTMRHASELAQHQVDSILKVETELQTIAAAVREITGLNEEMESAANEQSEVSDSINQNVIEISRSAEQTSSDAQETARIAGDLLAMAETLRKTIEQFRLSQS